MMFALGVELLMRRAMMTRWDNREEPEWPPHPDRVFMALVAAWGEGGEDVDQKAALEWLESLPAPAMRVNLSGTGRETCTCYVPANDVTNCIEVLPDRRTKNARTFPTFVPDEASFHLVWAGEEITPGHLAVLQELCSSVTYLGHSATPVRMWVQRDAIDANLFPTENSTEHSFRVFGAGRLADLIGRFNRAAIEDYGRLKQAEAELATEQKAATGAKKKELKSQLEATKALLLERHGDKVPRMLRPVPMRWLGYSSQSVVRPEEVQDGPFDPGLIVLRQIGGRRFSLESAGMIATAIRDTLMSRCSGPPPEWLSGHSPTDGSPSTIRRPTYLPLAFVDRHHADGHLLGIAIAVPRDFSETQVEELLQLLRDHGEPEDIAGEHVGYLELGVKNAELSREVGKLFFEIDDRPFSQRALALIPNRWIRPAACWKSVTPVVLPRFPRRELTPEQVIAKACVDAGYPDPERVRVGYASFLSGVPHSRSFHSRHKRDLPPRPLMHVELEFSVKVRGPLIIGAGRYNGFGFCKPQAEGEAK